MKKTFFRILLECVARDMISISVIYFIAIEISNKTNDIKIRGFCIMMGLILMWWVFLPFWDMIKEAKK